MIPPSLYASARKAHLKLSRVAEQAYYRVRQRCGLIRYFQASAVTQNRPMKVTSKPANDR